MAAAESKLTVVISSTAVDLPEHRKAATEACLRAGMFPAGMEAMPAADATALSESLALVDGAELYVGIYAHRYGHVPKGQTKSITHLEYERALERGIPILVFTMHPDHPVRASDVETGPGAAALANFKAALGAERVIAQFKSPDDLRGHLLHALDAYRQRMSAEGSSTAARLHYIADIPRAPEPYVAHPYTLLQTQGLIGRRPELEMLTDWITRPASSGNASLLCVVAIGGMGKSALTWHWYSKVVAQEMRPLSGRMWWSFYESDARFENFVVRALCYVSGRDRQQVEKQPREERERELLAVLDRQPFVFVLDGFERELIAYSGMSAPYQRDEDVPDELGHELAASGSPEGTVPSIVHRHPRRRATDPRVGAFLRRLAQVRASRVLMSTRLFPADLQTETGAPRPGCATLVLPGLRPEDALELWRAHGARGSREVMLPLFDTFERHPLLVQALAGEVARYRRAPGDFDAWRRAHPGFDPFRLPLVQVRSHVLAAALRGLSKQQARALHVLAGFRMPASLDTIQSLLMRTADEAAGGEASSSEKPFASLAELDRALAELEDRGLVGWDRRANRYDLHPIVRGVTWSGLGDRGQAGVYAALQVHFEAMPTVEEHDVESLEDLTPAIELFHSLTGLERYDGAFEIFRDRLNSATLWRLSANRQRVELLRRLFPDGLDALPRLSTADVQSFVLNAIAQGFSLGGEPRFALPLYRRSIELDGSQGEDDRRSVCLCNLSDALVSLGEPFSTASNACEALRIARANGNRFHEAVSVQFVGVALAIRGDTQGSEAALRRALRIFVHQRHRQSEGVTLAHLGRRALWLAQPLAARPLADRAWALAAVERNEYDFIFAARLQGAAALALGDAKVAEERLHHALARARACHCVDEELASLTALAELERRAGRPEHCRGLLDEVWELAERGPYRLLHADARNVLAQLERDAGDRAAAIDAAHRAFTLAWCQGPPWTYHFGLLEARQHLAAFQQPEPKLPPFDPSAFDPMPEVEIDPDDEFHAGRKPESSG